MRKAIVPVIELAVLFNSFALHGAAGSQRIVLGEFFTNTSCLLCLP